MTTFWKRAAIVSGILFILAVGTWGTTFYFVWTGSKNAPKEVMEIFVPPDAPPIEEELNGLENMNIPVPNIEQGGQ